MKDEKESSAPSYLAFQVSNGADDKSYLNRVGAAFPHKDGKGHTITLDAFPVDGRIVLRTPQERIEDARSSRPTRRTRDHER